jgi:hypothetical protein
MSVPNTTDRLITTGQFVAAIFFAFIAGMIFTLFYFKPMVPEQIDIDAGMKLECSRCVWYNIDHGPGPDGGG